MLTQTTDRVRVQDLTVVYRLDRTSVIALEKVNLHVRQEELVAIVGESGSGKSTLALSIIGLLPPSASVTGQILLGEENLSKLGRKEWTLHRGTRIGMVFQEPLSSLNPVTKIGDQMVETLRVSESRLPSDLKVYDYSAGRLHYSYLSRFVHSLQRTASPRMVEDALNWLKLVRIVDPESTLEKYPFELSGGMMQRVMIAMALSQKPQLLLADEPTTALDVTTQAQILRLMLDLRRVTKTSIVLITHDLAVAAQMGDRLVIMYAGEVVEDASKKELFANPLHPYTKSLIGCFPRGRKSENKLETIPGSVFDSRAIKQGCKFANRCRHANEKCRDNVRYVEFEREHFVRCTLYY
jgi:oligopeptide/dipeptide ABC transporter ATP-binding protein